MRAIFAVVGVLCLVAVTLAAPSTCDPNLDGISAAQKKATKAISNVDENKCCNGSENKCSNGSENKCSNGSENKCCNGSENKCCNGSENTSCNGSENKCCNDNGHGCNKGLPQISDIVSLFGF